MKAMLGAVLLLAACGSDDPCEGSAAGMRFVIHLPIEAHQPAELSVVYANDAFDRFDSAIPAEPWPDPLVFALPYGGNAVDGPAEVYFSSRPDPYRSARADVDVVLARCVTVEMTLQQVLDAGLTD